jgi:rubrerythrin
MKKFVCTVCGYVHEGASPPETCPLCGVPADKFEELPEAARADGI